MNLRWILEIMPGMHEYNGSESEPIDYIDYPLITEDEIEDNDVDVYAVFDYCYVAYCG